MANNRPRFEVIDAQPWHCGQIVRQLRPAHRAAIDGVGMRAHRSLRDCFDASVVRRAWLIDGELAAVGGICGTVLSSTGYLWLALGAVATRYPVALMKEARRQVDLLMIGRQELVATILLGDDRAAEFAARLGFEAIPDMADHHMDYMRLRRPVMPSRSATDPIYRQSFGAPTPWRGHQIPVWRHGVSDAPFIIYTAGRSRTAWLSAFLSYHGTQCHNEVAICFRGMDDVAAFFAAGHTGTAETAAAPAWRLINHYVPNIRSVVVRRPIEEIIASFARSEVAHIATIDEERLRRIVTYEDRCLQQISAQPGTLTVDFADLGQAETCARVFEHCLPYRFDRGWWEYLHGKNIQTNVADLFSYYRDNRDAVERFKREAKRDMIALARAGAFTLEA